MVASTAQGNTVQLSTANTQRILQQACRDGIEAHLTWVIAAEPFEVQVTFQRLDDDEICLELKTSTCTNDFPHGDVPVEVEFYLAQTRHSFRCHGVVAEPGQPSECIRIRRPESLQACDRRRSGRRMFRAGSRVRAWPHTGGRRSEISGPLLNLSLNGLAMRFHGETPRWMSAGETIRIHFATDEGLPDFDFSARVVSDVEGGTRECRVIGLEFIEDAAYAAAQRELVIVVGSLGQQELS